MSSNFNAFLSPNFVLNDWINASLSSESSNRIMRPSHLPSSDATSELSNLSIEGISKNITEGEQLDTSTEKKVFMLVTKLQLLSHELNKRLEATCENVTKSLPRIVYDLETIKQEALLAKGKITEIKKGVVNIVEKEDSALYDLVQLELIKSRMEASKNVLREAETWNNLGAEVSSLMAKKAYLDVTTRLEEAQKSLAMFQNSPEYEGRLTLLDNLRNQLEHALIPLLNTAVNGRDVENCKSLYNIFSRIHKEDVFMEMYFCSRQASLITLWEESFSEKINGSNVRDGGQLGKISTSNFSDFLQKFYEEAFIMINQEKTWCVEIFPNPGSVIYSLIRKVFNSLTPSLSSQIDLLAEQQPIVESLPELIRAFKASEKFGSTVEQLLYQLYEKNQTDKVIDFNHWGDPIFEGFLSHQCKYPEYESAYLDATLEKILKVDATKETGDKIVRYMLDVIPKTFNVIEAALSRCLYFTHGFASVGMARSVSQYICKLIGEFETHCDQLSSMFSDGNAVMLSQISEEEEAEVDEYQQVNWQLFQLGLELLSACKRISIQIEEYEKNAKTAILYTDNFLSKELELGKVSVDITVYDADSPTSFSIPTQDITVASLSLLKESTLNSLELRSLLIKLQNDAFTLTENPRLASKSFTRQCQKYLFNMLFATIKKQLIDFDKNPAWISNEAGTTSPLKLQIPKFSLSPSTYITRVGEYLLTLPQQLETYTGHESFGFSLDTLPYSQFLINEEISASPEPTTVSSPKLSSESPTSRHRSYSTVGGRPAPPGLNRARSYSTMSSDQSNPSNTTRTRRSSSVSGARPRLTSMNSSDQVFETNRRIEITHRWIASVAQATQSKLCDFILGLEKVTLFGSKQLATDIEYFTNILLAIDITPGYELLGIFKALEWSPKTLDVLIKGEKLENQEMEAEISEEDRKLLEHKEIREVLVQVMKIRGLHGKD